MKSRSGENLSLSSTEERELSIAVETWRTVFNKTSILYRRVRGKEAKIRVNQWMKVLPQLETEELFISHISGYINYMLDELSGKKGVHSIDGAAPPKEKDLIKDYDHENNLTDRRALYISSVMINSDEKTINSRDIRLLIEQKEGKKIFRSQVQRVCFAVTKFIAAKTEIFDGKRRIVRNPDFFNSSGGTAKLRLSG